MLFCFFAFVATPHQSCPSKFIPILPPLHYRNKTHTINREYSSRAICSFSHWLYDAVSKLAEAASPIPLDNSRYVKCFD